MLREKGSSVPLLEHDPADPTCIKAVAELRDDQACCTVCGVDRAREQAATAFNLRELGS